MNTMEKTDEFTDWLKNLKDRQGKAQILNHIDRMENGNMGNVEPVGSGVYEKKINFGPGYRLLYYCKRGKNWILLLCGGNKATQQADINKAISMKKGL